MKAKAWPNNRIELTTLRAAAHTERSALCTIIWVGWKRWCPEDTGWAVRMLRGSGWLPVVFDSTASWRRHSSGRLQRSHQRHQPPRRLLSGLRSPGFWAIWLGPGSFAMSRRSVPGCSWPHGLPRWLERECC